MKRVRPLLIGLSLFLISLLHYWSLQSDHSVVHEVTQRLYYLPIIYAAQVYGIRGGLGSALVSTLLFLPHVPYHAEQPSVMINQSVEVLVFLLIGTVTGIMTEAERRERERSKEIGAELQDACAQLKESMDRLLDADRLASLGQMSAAIVHEIRNPLASIKGASEALLHDLNDKEKLELIEIIKQEIDRLNRLAADFLQFGSPRNPDSQPTQLNEIVSSVLTLIEPQSNQQSVEIVTSQEEDLPLATIDGEQIKQALLNLVINAVQAAPGQRLEVSTARRCDEVVIRVRDHGQGIPSAIRDRIFEPFSTTKEGGSGLGLAIASRLVGQNKGSLTWKDAEDGGSIFEIALPAN